MNLSYTIEKEYETKNFKRLTLIGTINLKNTAAILRFQVSYIEIETLKFKDKSMNIYIKITIAMQQHVITQLIKYIGALIT